MIIIFKQETEIKITTMMNTHIGTFVCQYYYNCELNINQQKLKKGFQKRKIGNT